MDDTSDVPLDGPTRLREYLDWVSHEGETVTCCLKATATDLAEAEALEAQGEVLYDCTDCPLRLRRETLTPDDQRALDIYGLLARPVVRDLHLTALVFDILDLRSTQAEALAFLDRLHAIHTVRLELQAEEREAQERQQADAAPTHPELRAHART